MSDEDVRRAIVQMEAWLGDPTWEPDAEVLAQWNATFLGALALAEKAHGWEDLVARAHAAGRSMELHAITAAEVRDQLRAELQAQDHGKRALKGYGASAR